MIGVFAGFELKTMARSPMWRTMKTFLLAGILLTASAAHAGDPDSPEPKQICLNGCPWIPSPFRFEKGYTIPGVAQVQTYYVYPTMEDAPSWLTAKQKKKPRMPRPLKTPIL